MDTTPSGYMPIITLPLKIGWTIPGAFREDGTFLAMRTDWSTLNYIQRSNAKKNRLESWFRLGTYLLILAALIFVLWEFLR